MEYTNDVITAVTLLKKSEGMLHADDREPLNKHRLQKVFQRINMCLNLIGPYINTPLVLGPMAQLLELLEAIDEDPRFTETNAETKKMICDLFGDAFVNLCVQAGKYYTDHEFDFSETIIPTLKVIVDVCIENNYFFGMESEV